MDSAHNSSDTKSPGLLQRIESSVVSEAFHLAGLPAKDAHADPRQIAVEAINKDFNTIARLSEFLPDGTIDPQSLIHTIRAVTGSKLDSSTVKFLSNFDSITKHGDHFDLHSVHGVALPINESLGPAGVQALKVSNDLSFNLTRDKNGNPELADIKGLNLAVSSSVPGVGDSAAVQGVTIDKGKNGQALFDVKVDNPASPLLQGVLREPGAYDVRVQLGDNGKGTVLNGQQLKQQAIGGNPFVQDGAQTASDSSKFINSPSVSGFGQVLLDGANTVFVGAPDTAANYAGDAANAVWGGIKDLNPFS